MPVDPKRVQAVFLAAVEAVEPAGRDAVLQRECGGDAELRQRVEALLRAHDQPGGLLVEPLPPAGAEASTQPARPLPVEAATKPPAGGTGIPLVVPEHMTVPGYEILGELGRGGMGVVYQARQVGLNRVVALKMVLAGGHASEEDLARFRTEAEAIARLQHPHIVQVFDIGEHHGTPYFSQEFCPGGSLATKLSGTPLPPRQAAALVETLARAVHAAHQAGILHRDLKPANVLLTADNQPKIADFGLAKKLGEAGQTATGAVMGTPSYMAPEQAGGKSKELGPAADVYALGAILYECLTGRPPFKAATPLDTLLQVMSESPVPPRRLQRTIPADLQTVCLKCLEKAPGQRYKSAEALAADLRRFLEGKAIHARRPSVRALTRAWLRHPARMRDAGLLQIWVALTSAAVSFSFTYFALWSGRHGWLLWSSLLLCMAVLGAWIGLKTIAGKPWALWAGLAFSLVSTHRQLNTGYIAPVAAVALQPDTPFRLYFQFPHLMSLLGGGTLDLLLVVLSCVALDAYYQNRKEEVISDQLRCQCPKCGRDLPEGCAYCPYCLVPTVPVVH
jgi:hypothetical protein